MKLPVLISRDEYKELQNLRSYYIREEKLDSIKSTKKLENDIDLPIRTIVGMFALLGCQPRFSCCGFDYHGQPIHKTHEYGNAYVMMNDNINTDHLIALLVESKFLVNTKEKTSMWRTWKDEVHKVVFVALAFDWEDSQREYPWSNKNCVHYAEKGVIGLHHLRKMIYYRFRNSFLDNIVLEDSNKHHSKTLAYWQYPSLGPWEINKEKLLVEVEKELSI